MSYGFLEWFNRMKTIQTNEGMQVEIWQFNHSDDTTVLSEWAKHFRKMYSEDENLDEFRSGTGLSRSEYLLKMVFPDEVNDFGPATRSGDFAEILIADFLEYLNGFWIPRVRYDGKATRNNSTQGSDVVGFKLKNKEKFDRNDELIVFEVKAQFSGNKAKSRLQDAVNDSNKDVTRIGEFLNYTKRKFIREGRNIEKTIIERFQNISDNPFVERFGAAALFNENVFDEELLKQTKCDVHSKKDKLILLAFTGNDMMNLVHAVYKRAADEA